MHFQKIPEEIYQKIVPVPSVNVSHALLLSGNFPYALQQSALFFSQLLFCETSELLPCGKCQNCIHFLEKNHSGFKEINSERSEIQVHTIEEILAESYKKDFFGSRKITVIYDAEKMNLSAANKFLKLLESPPEGQTFILTTRDSKQILPTIFSRCQLFKILHPDISEKYFRKFLYREVISGVNATDFSRNFHPDIGLVDQWIEISLREILFQEDFSTGLQSLEEFWKKYVFEIQSEFCRNFILEFQVRKLLYDHLLRINHQNLYHYKSFIRSFEKVLQPVFLKNLSIERINDKIFTLNLPENVGFPQQTEDFDKWVSKLEKGIGKNQFEVYVLQPIKQRTQTFVEKFIHWMSIFVRDIYGSLHEQTEIVAVDYREEIRVFSTKIHIEILNELSQKIMSTREYLKNHVNRELIFDVLLGEFVRMRNYD